MEKEPENEKKSECALSSCVHNEECWPQRERFSEKHVYTNTLHT